MTIAGVIFPGMTIFAAEPIFAVRDIARSIALYRDVLDFERTSRG